MNEHFFEMLIPLIGLLSGLIGAYVGLQNRALLAEVRRELAETEYRICERINGKYVRSQVCELREDLMQERLGLIMEEMKKRNAAGD